MAGFKALIVDDSPTVRQHVIHALGEISGLSCTEAADGAEAIRRLGGELYDLIVTDLQMPMMNGYAFIQYLRHRTDTKGIPILVITAAGTEDDRRKLAETGVTAFLRKPFDTEQLIGLARSLLPKVQTGAAT